MVERVTAYFGKIPEKIVYYDRGAEIHMYAYIKGELTLKAKDYLVVETGGVGYKIYASVAGLSRIGVSGDEVKVFTYFHVKENEMNLFGFATQEELSVFELVITVSGVGPKVALSILDSVSPSKFCLAVVSNDAKTLTAAQGVGLKLAQRIILELKDKLSKEKPVARGEVISLSDVPNASLGKGKLTEAINAMCVLGYSLQEANNAVSKVYSEEKDVEKIIVEALRNV